MASIRVTESAIFVTIEISREHPVVKLKENLDWSRIESVLGYFWRKDGRNIDGRPGRPFDLSFWTRVMVLMFFLGFDSRKMERELKENALTCYFVHTENPTEGFERDHSNIERAYASLGPDGVEALNHLIVDHAVQREFAETSQLSADPTCQEAHIGYPNEPGILRKTAERVKRLCGRLLKKGIEVGGKVLEQAQKVLSSVKEHHLFCKNKEEKGEKLQQIVEESKDLMESVGELEEVCAAYHSDTTIRKVGEKIRELRHFISRLTPQIMHGLETGEVASGKLLHPSIQEANAIVRNKDGKKTEFGFKWLLCWITGGYVFGRSYFGIPGESCMPQEAIALYQRAFGTGKVPELYVHDRGGWSKKNVKELQAMGIEKVGIQPKGQASWCVEESDRDTVRSLRAMTEGSIGTIKTEKYRFNRPKTKSTRTTFMAGQRAFVSKNLNKFLCDVLKAEKAISNV